MTNVRNLVAGLLLPFFTMAPAQAGEYVNTSIQKTADYYVWITMLSPGEKIWNNLSDKDYERLGEKAIAARQFRIAVTTSEIYNTVYLEEITEGPEGCCRKFVKIRQLDLNDMQKKFNLRGELAGFEVYYWTSPTSFKFKLQDRTFDLSGLDKLKVFVEEEAQTSTNKPFANKPLEPTR
jgi:hypothetical protein